MRCLRDDGTLERGIEPHQPELLYRCPRCGTGYDHVFNMLPKPVLGSRSPAQQPGVSSPGSNLGIPAPPGKVEQIGRLVWIVGIIVFCGVMLLFWPGK